MKRYPNHPPRARRARSVRRGHRRQRDDHSTVLYIGINGWQLWALPSVDRLDKVRTAIRVGSVEATVDTYAGDLAPMRVAEVEFATLAGAAAFEPPAWFGPEVTGQKRYGNRALAKQASARSTGPEFS